MKFERRGFSISASSSRHVPEGLDASAEGGTLSPYCFRHSRPASSGPIRVQYGFPRSGAPGTCTGAFALSPWPSLCEARKTRGCQFFLRVEFCDRTRTSLAVEIFLLPRSSRTYLLLLSMHAQIAAHRPSHVSSSP